MTKRLHPLLALLFVVFNTLGVLYAQSMSAIEKRAASAFDHGNYIEALPDYRQLLAQNQKNPNYNYRYGTCLFYTTDINQAAKYYDVLIAKGSIPDPTLYYYRARIYQHQFLFRKAIEHYQSYQKESVSLKHPLDVSEEIAQCERALEQLHAFGTLQVLKKQQATSAFYEAYVFADQSYSFYKAAEVHAKNNQKHAYTPIYAFKRGMKYRIFASYGTSGDQLDLYIQRKNADNNWDEIVRISGPVNTALDEGWAFYDESSKKLFYSSKFQSIGGYDLFSADFDLSTAIASASVALGFPYSSPDDDLFYVVDPGANRANFASNRNGQLHLYECFYIETNAAPRSLFFFTGILMDQIDATNHSVRLEFEDPVSGERFGPYTSEQDASYVVGLPGSGTYLMRVSIVGASKTFEQEITLPNLAPTKALVQELRYAMVDSKEKLEVVQRIIDKERLQGVEQLAAMQQVSARLEPNVRAWNHASTAKLTPSFEQEWGIQTSDTTQFVSILTDSLLAAEVSLENQVRLTEVLRQAYASQLEDQETLVVQLSEALKAPVPDQKRLLALQKAIQQSEDSLQFIEAWLQLNKEANIPNLEVLAKIQALNERAQELQHVQNTALLIEEWHAAQTEISSYLSLAAFDAASALERKKRDETVELQALIAQEQQLENRQQALQTQLQKEQTALATQSKKEQLQTQASISAHRDELAQLTLEAKTLRQEREQQAMKLEHLQLSQFAEQVVLASEKQQLPSRNLQESVEELQAQHQQLKEMAQVIQTEAQTNVTSNTTTTTPNTTTTTPNTSTNSETTTDPNAASQAATTGTQAITGRETQTQTQAQTNVTSNTTTTTPNTSTTTPNTSTNSETTTDPNAASQAATTGTQSITGRETQTQAEAQTQIQTEAQTQIQTEAQTNVTPNSTTTTPNTTTTQNTTTTNQNTSTNSETTTDPNAASQAATTGTQSITGSETQIQAEAQTQTQAEAQTQIQTEAQTQTQAEAQTQTQTEAQTETQTQTQTNVTSNTTTTTPNTSTTTPNTSTNSETTTDPNAASQAATTGTQAITGSETQIQTEAQTQTQAEAQTQIQTEAQTQTQAEAQTQIQTEAQTNVTPNSTTTTPNTTTTQNTTTTNQNTSTNSETTTDPNAASQAATTGTQAMTGSETQTQTQTETQTQAEAQTQTQTEAQAQRIAQVDALVDLESGTQTLVNLAQSPQSLAQQQAEWQSLEAQLQLPVASEVEVWTEAQQEAAQQTESYANYLQQRQQYESLKQSYSETRSEQRTLEVLLLQVSLEKQQATDPLIEAQKVQELLQLETQQAQKTKQSQQLLSELQALQSQFLLQKDEAQFEHMLVQGKASVAATTESYSVSEAATTATPLPINVSCPSGLVFRVQVGAFRYAVPPQLFREFSPVDGQTLKNGLTVYMAGYFASSAEALQTRTEIRAMGYQDAFIVAYCDGKRISYAEGRQLELTGGCGKASNLVAFNTIQGRQQQQPQQQTKPEINQELFYTVQIGVYNRPVQQNTIKGVGELIETRSEKGQYRYASGEFTTLASAKTRQKEAVQKGIPDAYIVAYYQGKRISIAEARQLEANGIRARTTLQQQPIAAAPSMQKPAQQRIQAPVVVSVLPPNPVIAYQLKCTDDCLAQLMRLNRVGLFCYEAEKNRIVSIAMPTRDWSPAQQLYLIDLKPIQVPKLKQVERIHVNTDGINGATFDYLLRQNQLLQLEKKGDGYELIFEKPQFEE